MPHTTVSPSPVPHTTVVSQMESLVLHGVPVGQSEPSHREPQTMSWESVPQSGTVQLQSAQLTPHLAQGPGSTSQLGEQITPHAIGCPDADFAAPQTVPDCHALASAASRLPFTRWLPQNSRLLHVASAGYATVDGAARKFASSTAPCAFRNPTPSVSINSSLGPLSADFFLANGVNQFRITIKTFLTSSEPFSFARLTVRPLSSGAISAISSAFSSLYANALNSGDSIGCGCGFVPFKIPMVSVGSFIWRNVGPSR